MTADFELQILASMTALLVCWLDSWLFTDFWFSNESLGLPRENA